MNKERRSRIEELVTELEDIQSRIDDLFNEEEEAFEALPESFQDGERGELMQEAMDNLSSARDSAEESVSMLQEAAA